MSYFNIRTNCIHKLRGFMFFFCGSAHSRIPVRVDKIPKNMLKIRFYEKSQLISVCHLEFANCPKIQWRQLRQLTLFVAVTTSAVVRAHLMASIMHHKTGVIGHRAEYIFKFDSNLSPFA